MKLRDNHRIQEEKDLIETMISIYCKGKGHKRKENQELCESCNELKIFAFLQINKCVKLDTNQKAICGLCKYKCYSRNKEMELKMKEVMKYSGPRMIFKHPIKTIKHVF